MKLLPLAALALGAAMATSGVSAETITGGLFFNGGSTNYFDPANGLVPPGYGNSAGVAVPVSDGVEFGFDDTSNLDTADFTASMLTLSDTAEIDGTNNPFVETFTSDVAGAFDGLSLVSTTFAGLTYSVAGNTLTISVPGFEVASGENFSAVFARPSAGAVPEPASWALMISGFGLVGGALRTSRRSVAIAA